METGLPISPPFNNPKGRKNSYILVQLKDSELSSVFSTARELSALPGLVAASEISGIFDLIAKVNVTGDERERILREIRARPDVEFATSFEVGSIYLSGIASFGKERAVELEKE